MNEPTPVLDPAAAPEFAAVDAWIEVIEEAAAKAREGLDYAAFEAWLVDRLADVPQPPFMTTDVTADVEPRRVAISLARALWRLMPLDANDYRGFSLPEPGRNEPCFCGSGSKYKQCCERLFEQAVAGINPELVWDAMLPTIPPATVARLAGQGRVPLWSLGEYARGLSDDDRLEEAAGCLAPLFSPPLRHLDAEAAGLLDELHALYEDLGELEAQDEMLMIVAQQAPRSFVRAEACHLMARLLADEGSWDEAFDFLHAAMDDSPDDPRFGVLEIRLLVAVGQLPEARQAATTWRRLVENTSAELLDPEARDELLALYRAAERDPAGTLLAATLAQLPDEDGEFLAGLAEACQRPLPDYALVPVDAPPTGEIPADVNVLLVTPPAREDVERDWRRLFPLAKPLGNDDEPADAADAWADPAWRQFLAANPEAWDSLWVLDDLATAIGQYEFPGIVTWTRGYRTAVLQRAAAIVHRALGARPLESLPWDCPENRPALRSLRRLEALRST